MKNIQFNCKKLYKFSRTVTGGVGNNVMQGLEVVKVRVSH